MGRYRNEAGSSVVEFVLLMLPLSLVAQFSVVMLGIYSDRFATDRKAIQLAHVSALADATVEPASAAKTHETMAVGCHQSQGFAISSVTCWHAVREPSFK
jgi:hypothetical protein